MALFGLAATAPSGRMPPAAATAVPTPPPEATPSTPAPDVEPKPRLRLDVERHVERLLRPEPGGLPRFQETVDVFGWSAEQAFERHLRGFETECGPTAGGAPTEAETRELRHHVTPYLDFLALGRLLAGMLKGRPAERFHLYRIRDGAGTRHWLREGPLPEAGRLVAPAAEIELVATFEERDEAVQAWRRLERGFAAPLPPASASPLPPWVLGNCRPPRD